MAANPLRIRALSSAVAVEEASSSVKGFNGPGGREERKSGLALCSRVVAAGLLFIFQSSPVPAT
jgi:hypothetical protein